MTHARPKRDAPATSEPWQAKQCPGQSSALPPGTQARGTGHRLAFGLLSHLALLSTSINAATCWEAAGIEYGVNPVLLKAIALKESRGWQNAMGPRLPDGNRALGLMQINTVHLPILAKHGIRQADLFDACTNQRVGAWVLASCITRFGNVWKAVGCYYTGPASRNAKAQTDYVRDVERFYQGYQGTPEPQTGSSRFR